MDEEFKQKMQFEVNQPLSFFFVNAPKMRGMKKRQAKWSGEPQLQEMMFYERFRNPVCTYLINFKLNIKNLWKF